MLLFVWIIPKVSFAGAQERVTLDGKVTELVSQEPIPYAQVLIKELNIWGFSDDKGLFKISGIIPGAYTLEVKSLGYQKFEMPITLQKNVSGFKAQMKVENLTLDDVVVTAKAGGSMNSSSRVDKQAIEHVQATSLADIMQLMPGSIIQNPSLVEENRIAIRSISSNPSNARGVGVLINGAKLSGDANIAITTDPNDPTPQPDLLDFRTISTDNIESVEVLKGVLSAEYGDVTSGAIIVKTKVGYTPYEVRVKADPRTKAVSFGKGFSLGANKGNLNVNADYAKSFKDWRSPVEEFERVTLGVAYSNTFDLSGKPLRFNARVSGYHTGNSKTSDPDVSNLDFKEYKDNNLNISLYGTWQLNKPWITTLDYNVSGSYAEKNSRLYVVSNKLPLPTTNTKQEGIALGRFTSTSDINDQRINEVPIYFNAKVSGKLNKSVGGSLFKSLLGVEFNTKGNNGDGLYHAADVPQYFRSRKYSEIPFMSDISAFAEEKVTIPVGKNKSSIELIAGVRFTKMMVDGYDYDPTIDPRFNAKYNIIAPKRKGLIRELSLRGGWGIMQKLPSMSILYPDPIYMDNALFSYRNSETGESLALIQTSIIDGMLDYNLDPIKTNNFEIGLDVNVKGIQARFTYFNEKSRDGYTDNSHYVPQNVNFYDNVSDPNAAPKYENGTVWVKNQDGNYEELSYTSYNQFKGYKRPDNRGAIDKWGIEYDFDFGTLKSINTSLIVNGAYIKTEDYSTGQMNWYRNANDPIDPQSDNKYIGIFNSNADGLSLGYGRERLSTNISFVTRIPSIRMIVSFTTQCIWMENNWNIYDEGNIYTQDSNGNAVYGDYNNKSTLSLLYRDPVAYMDKNGTVKPFSDYHTTNDPDLKRRLDLLRLATNNSFYFLETGFKPYFMANIRVTKELGDIASLSFYANNFTNSRPIMVNKARPNIPGITKNTEIYFGAELKLTF
ncbi:MAG: TonB-dependent receptor [Bacteroidales bacterium]